MGYKQIEVLVWKNWKYREKNDKLMQVQVSAHIHIYNMIVNDECEIVTIPSLTLEGFPPACIVKNP